MGELQVYTDPVVRDPVRTYEFRDQRGSVVTVPDFAWPTASVAVFVDGAPHFKDEEVIALDHRKRNFVERHGWSVLVYTGNQVRDDASRVASEIVQHIKRREELLQKIEDANNITEGHFLAGARVRKGEGGER